ncbi:MAG TPA: YjbH domain-containing protein, partial [Paracoccaceae bacterium]|nr:YjbH domain-containing protein [Paracoccaceae bacterium]
MNRLLLAGVLTGLVGLVPAAVAEEPESPQRPTRNLFGMTGLIDMPTAEMQPDGEVALGAGYFGTTLRTTLSAQFLPWLEVAFRYTKVTDWGSAGDEIFGRSFDAKLRLVEEGETWPAIVIGLQDFIGTGIYSGEYLAATKGFKAGELGEFRVTGGLGWGRFAGEHGFRNPFCTVPGGDEFCERSRRPGKGLNFGRYFGGEDMSAFGGIEWITPMEGLTAKLEYSPDSYLGEHRGGAFDQKNQFNFGLDYQPADGVEIGAYYMYG